MTVVRNNEGLASARVPITAEVKQAFLPIFEKHAQGVQFWIDLETNLANTDPDVRVWWRVDGIDEDSIGFLLQGPDFKRSFGKGIESARNAIDLLGNLTRSGTDVFVDLGSTNASETIRFDIEKSASGMAVFFLSVIGFDTNSVEMHNMVAAIVKRLNYAGSFAIDIHVLGDGRESLKLTLDGDEGVESNQGIRSFRNHLPVRERMLVCYSDADCNLPTSLPFEMPWEPAAILSAIEDCCSIASMEVTESQLFARADVGGKPVNEPVDGFWDVQIFGAYKKKFNPYKKPKSFEGRHRYPIWQITTEKEAYLKLQVDVVHEAGESFFDFQTSLGREFLQGILDEFDLPGKLWDGPFELRWLQSSLPKGNSASIDQTKDNGPTEIESQKGLCPDEAPTVYDYSEFAAMAEEYAQFMSENCDVPLDFSEASFQALDDYFASTHPDGIILDMTLEHIAVYAGETVRRNLGGFWVLYETTTPPMFMVLIGRFNANVFAWTRKVNTLDPAESFVSKYSGLRQKVMLAQ